MRVCIGGTFYILHKGHKQLIDKAFQTAGKDGNVFIGITEESFLQNKEFVKPFNERVNAVKEYLFSMDYDQCVVIKPISDKYGPAVNGDFDAIIVSPETIGTAEEINKKRADIGKKPLKIVKIEFVLADDDKPISSTRVYKNEIDENGRVL